MNRIRSLMAVLLVISALFGCGSADPQDTVSSNAPTCLPADYSGEGCPAEYQTPCDYFVGEFHYINENPDWSCMETHFK